MHTTDGGVSIAVGMALGGFSPIELFLRSFSNGGNMTVQSIVDYMVTNGSTWPSIEHDVVAQALNEMLAELGIGPVVSSTEDLRRT
jgi:hypothetical protein